MTTYLMMNRDGNANLPFRDLQAPSLRSEAGLVDPAINSLFEMEDALAHMPQAEKKATNNVGKEKIRRAPSGRPRHYFVR